MSRLLLPRSPSMSRGIILLARTVLALLLASAQAAHAQDWPQKPVRIVIPYSAGGNADLVARIIAQSLAASFGQQFIADNRPGAAGALASEAVARSPGDGYTLMLATLPQMAIVPAVSKVT